MARAHTIVYVPDQSAAREFWRATLAVPPQLDVPGMTVFALGSDAVLGLMPAADISELLPALGGDVARTGARVELYLVTDDADAHHSRSIEAGGTELSPMARRSWGADVAYSLSPDGTVVVAFARS